MGEREAHRVVVVGGGFGGLQAAKHLRQAPADLTLVDRRNFHLFQPLLYQVATGALSPGEIASPLRGVLRHHPRATVVLAEVDGHRPRGPAGHRPGGGGGPADGAGVRHADRRGGRRAIPTSGTRSGSRSRRASSRWRTRWSCGGASSRSFEAAEAEPDPELQRAWLTFVIVGAGPTGVELAGQIAEIARDTVRHDFRHIDPTTRQHHPGRGRRPRAHRVPAEPLREGEAAAREAGRDRAHRPPGDRRRPARA